MPVASFISNSHRRLVCFVFVASGDGSHRRPESGSASVGVGESWCDRGLVGLMGKGGPVGSWLKKQFIWQPKRHLLSLFVFRSEGKQSHGVYEF
jgi:hypothetical protein